MVPGPSPAQTASWGCFSAAPSSTPRLPKGLVKEVNSILYGFIWNGKDKVKRQALVSDPKKGGLKMLDIESMIKAKRVAFMKKKILEEYPSPWKTILNNLLSPIGGCFVLHCNFDTSKLKIQLPAYYKECLEAWSDLTGKSEHSSRGFR